MGDPQSSPWEFDQNPTGFPRGTAKTRTVLPPSLNPLRKYVYIYNVHDMVWGRPADFGQFQ